MVTRDFYISRLCTYMRLGLPTVRTIILSSVNSTFTIELIQDQVCPVSPYLYRRVNPGPVFTAVQHHRRTQPFNRLWALAQTVQPTRRFHCPRPALHSCVEAASLYSTFLFAPPRRRRLNTNRTFTTPDRYQIRSVNVSQLYFYSDGRRFHATIGITTIQAWGRRQIQ